MAFSQKQIEEHKKLMERTYKKKSPEDKAQEIEELLQGAEQEIENYFEKPEDLKKLMDFQAQFYNYSIRNCALIQKQFDGANAVGSYHSFQEKGLNVKKGEKGIRILACNQSKYFKREDGKNVAYKEATEEDKKKIKAGEYEIKTKNSFYPCYVYDISQTDARAEEIPKLYPNRWLEGDVKDYEKVMGALKQYGEKIGAKLIEPEIEMGAAKGLAFPDTKEVALNPRNSELQNVKTLVHELTHATLHSGKNNKKYEPHEKEFQAELSAYVVCKHLGLETDEYSIKYMHDWTEGKELKDKIQLLNEVNKTARTIIDVVEKEFEQEKVQRVERKAPDQAEEKKVAETGEKGQEKTPEKAPEKADESKVEEKEEPEIAPEEGKKKSAQNVIKNREFSNLQLTKADDEMADLVLLCAQVAGVPLATAGELGALTALKESDRLKGMVKNTVEEFRNRKFEKEVEKSADIKMPEVKEDKKLSNKEIAMVFLTSELTKYPEEVRDNKDFRDILGKEKALETSLYMLQEKAADPNIEKEELDVISDKMINVKQDLENVISEKNEIIKNNTQEVVVEKPEQKNLGVLIVENELMKLGKEERNAATLQAAAMEKATKVVIDTQELRIPNREKKNVHVQKEECTKINKTETSNKLNIYQHKNDPQKCFIGQDAGNGKIRKLSKDSSMEESLKSYKGLMQEQKAAGVVKVKEKDREQERERAV